MLLLVAVLAGCGDQSGPPGPDRPPDPGPAIVLDMVVIEAGAGSPPFLFDRFEVTNTQFAEFLAATGYRWTQGDPGLWDADGAGLRPEGRGAGSSPPQ